jgi:hypothetical protein
MDTGLNRAEDEALVPRARPSLDAFDDAVDDEPKPNSLVVVGMLLLTAAVFSYLGAFAIADALASARFITPWPPHDDPRPRWFVFGFAAMVAAFVAVWLTVRVASRRQLRHIDRMDADDA